ncbi:hypothetical protein QBC32DRAFT_389569 [Pseudoneurospora amorphoporcata]|uniref:Uncharacterized protein n=1 Tax=Pseudoneurospora amorphoporcata TaxID=241081 RepID=A0AAN6SFS3_9PEZI|nr:hypothetical protein QBC32DRAFT_389569 [Pseudoneurospora amorphoporcata]
MSSSDNTNNKQDLNALAYSAERDLNTWQSKTGHRRTGLDDDTGINEFNASKKFPGTEIQYGDNLVTNKSYDRKIPQQEGGDLDDKGHLLHGHFYEGTGGPEDKVAHLYQHSPGSIDESVVRGWGKDPRKLTAETVDPSRPDLLPSEMARGHGYENTEGKPRRHHEGVLEAGRKAAESNVFGVEDEAELAAHRREDLPRGGHHHQFRGSEYEAPESVPDQGADMNEVPPESVVEISRNLR